MKNQYKGVRFFNRYSEIKELKAEGLNSLVVSERLGIDLVLVNECFAEITRLEAIEERAQWKTQVARKPE